jgi:hypothetical protein
MLKLQIMFFLNLRERMRQLLGGQYLGVPNNDDNNFGTFPIGFNFTYNGVAYTQFGVNANGFITLGTVPTSSYVSLSGVLPTMLFLHLTLICKGMLQQVICNILL